MKDKFSKILPFFIFSPSFKSLLLRIQMNKHMKKTFLVSIALILGLISACNQTIQTTEKTPVSDETKASISGTYGADLAEMPQLTASQLVDEVTKNGSFEGQIAGQIKEVCASKGCWLTMDLPSGQSMRVTFKDYGFFVPTNSAGFPVILEGIATLTETDVATLRHYAEDAGKSKEEVAAITEPKKEITFEAVGVVIKEKA
jgi:hypothetical protein